MSDFDTKNALEEARNQEANPLPQHVEENEEGDSAEKLANARKSSASSIANTLKKAKGTAKMLTPKGIFSILTQASIFKDLPFVAAFGAAIFKDTLDLAFIASLPGIGTVITMMCSIFIGMMLTLSGSGEKRSKIRGIFKRILVLIGGTMVEFLPGIDFFPFETITVFVIYVWTLIDRSKAQQVEEEA